MSVIRLHIACLALLAAACTPVSSGSGTDWPWENPDGPEKPVEPEKPEFVWEDVSGEFSVTAKGVRLLR